MSATTPAITHDFDRDSPCTFTDAGLTICRHLADNSARFSESEDDFYSMHTEYTLQKNVSCFHGVTVKEESQNDCL